MKLPTLRLTLAVVLSIPFSASAEMTEVGALEAISHWRGGYAPNTAYTEMDSLSVIRHFDGKLTFSTPTAMEGSAIYESDSTIRETDLARLLIETDAKTPAGQPLEIKLPYYGDPVYLDSSANRITGYIALRIDRESGQITGYGLASPPPHTRFQKWKAKWFPSAPREQHYLEANRIERSTTFDHFPVNGELTTWERYLEDTQTLEEARTLRKELANPAARIGRRAPVRAKLR